MALTEEQWDKMYDLSVANGTHIEWIRKTLTENAVEIDDCKKRVRCVETDQAFIKGRMVRFAGGVAVVCAIAVNGILWFFSHLGGL
jgi:hypothetical protein